ncbi:MAG: hypothetical protein ACFFDB_00740 [Promethearchaeota archaeon]
MSRKYYVTIKNLDNQDIIKFSGVILDKKQTSGKYLGKIVDETLIVSAFKIEGFIPERRIIISFSKDDIRVPTIVDWGKERKLKNKRKRSYIVRITDEEESIKLLFICFTHKKEQTRGFMTGDVDETLYISGLVLKQLIPIRKRLLTYNELELLGSIQVREFNDSFDLYEAYLHRCLDYECVEKLIKTGKSLGAGNFSEAFKLGEHIVIKRSLYASAISEMKDEVKVFNKLKDKYGDILPKRLRGFYFEKDNKYKYYIIREFGNDPEEKKVSQKKYDKFISRLYDLAANVGIFYDKIQIGIRDNGDVFLTDLGDFVLKENLREEKLCKDGESSTICMKRILEQLITILDGELDLLHYLPDF